MASPLDGKRHPDAAFRSIHLKTAQRIVTGKALYWRTVITKEENECIGKKIICLEGLHDASHTIIQSHFHRRQELPVRVSDIGNAIEIFLRRFVGLMRRVIGEVEKERLCDMAINKGDRLASERIGKILAFVN